MQPGATIYVLDGLLPGAEPHYAGFDLRPVLSSLPEVRDWAAYCRARGRRLPAAIHIDTGMNRLGMPESEVEQLAAAPDLLAAFETTLVMSHLACADHADDPMNERQRQRFEELRAKLPPAPASLANSGGTFLGPAYHFDLVRPGIALYGGRAHEGKPNPMQTVVRLAARILQVREVAPGATIGYGATYKVQRPSRIATIACGYADGFLRALSVATGEAGPVGYIGDYPVPIVGRVSMDFITADVTERAAGAGAARRLGGGDGPPRHRRRPDRPRRHHRLRAALPPRPARLSRLRGGGELSAMAKAAKSQFVCQNCGAVAPRWAGKCAACGEWNTHGRGGRRGGAAGLRPDAQSSKGRAVDAARRWPRPTDRIARMPTGLAELDRVTGGGIVPGSALLIGGEPGIGKSTLLLQLAAAFANAGRRAIYFSGEEAAAQVRLRAERLGLSQAPLALACETNLANILATLAEGSAPISSSSIRSRRCGPTALEAAPGTVSQVRAATQSLVRFAKAQGAALVLVGHVTKDGQIAGPKVIEHMVDTVLYFEGDRGHAFRILRAAKNRFGATDEIGVFEMAAEGLREVANPSELFLGDRLASTPGSAVFAGVEGTRPILVEIQALVVPSGLGTPRRAVVGWDTNRLVHAARRHRCALRHQLCPARRLSQRRRRPEDHRARRRPRRRRRPAVVNLQCCARRRSGSTSGRSACRGRSGRPDTCWRASRKPRSWGSSRRSCRPPASSTPAGSSSRCHAWPTSRAWPRRWGCDSGTFAATRIAKLARD